MEVGSPGCSTAARADPGTVWAHRKLRDTGIRTPARPDWWGNLTFAAGLIAVLAGITYGIQPYGGHTMGWSNPAVLATMAGGVLLAAGTFLAMQALPVDFGYPSFALILLLNGIGMGLFAAPNRAAVMNSLPPDRRGVGAGISTTFQNSAMLLSIGIFFSLMIAGLAGTLPRALTSGLTAQGVPVADAAKVAALPPVGVLFASLLGYNPVRTLLGPQVLDRLPPDRAAP